MTTLTELGIAVCVVTYGKAVSFAGTDLGVSMSTIAVDADGKPIRLVWDATGTVFSAFPEAGVTSDGVARQVLPQTGQDGFVIPAVVAGVVVKVATKNYYLRTTVEEKAPGQGSRTSVYRYQIPTGVTALELERLPADGPAPAGPVSVIIPPVSVSDLGGKLSKASNLADLPDKEAARTNLGVQSASEADAAYEPIGLSTTSKATVRGIALVNALIFGA